MPLTKQHRLLIATTTPETLATILAGQPLWLSRHFDVVLLTSPDQMAERVAEQEGRCPEFVPMTRGIAPLADIVSIWRAYRKIRRLRPDIIHSYTPKAGLIMMFAGWVARVPIRMHTFTGLIFPSCVGLKRRLLMAADWMICACATHVVPEGAGVGRDLKSHGITRKPLRIIANGNIAGVDIDYFDPDDSKTNDVAQELRGKLGIEPEDRVLGFVGRLNRDKGLDELVSAFEEVSVMESGRGGRLHLICLGDLDPTAPVAPGTITLMQRHPDIHLPGWQTDIRPYFLLMDALVLPSYREGFPNVLLQASAMGLPLVASDINGSNEIVVPNETGWLVPPRDAKALAAALEALLDLPPTARQDYGRRARARTSRLYKRSMVREGLLDFYRSLIDECQSAERTNKIG